MRDEILELSEMGYPPNEIIEIMDFFSNDPRGLLFFITYQRAAYDDRREYVS